MNSEWFTKFSIWFYICFFVVSLLGYIIFRFNSLGLDVLVYYFIYVISFVFGTGLGRSLKPVKIKTWHIGSRKVLNILLPLSASAILLGWYYMINHYGALSYIIAHSHDVRGETIGDGIQIIPTAVSYLSCFGNVGFVLSVSRFYHKRERRDLYMAFCFAILILMVDLQSFGRVGILFIIFVLVGCVRLFRIKIRILKLLISGFALFFILMLPRWIRGGSSLEGVSDTYLPYLQFKLPSFCDPFVSLYAYYFSGLFAFNELLNEDIPLWMGQRNFSSLVNLFHRFFVSETEFHRVTIIANPVNVPYSINIYSILGEAYMDFGILGLIILPFFFGSCIGLFYKYRGVYADALKLVFVGWLFYTPIYNLFSFGGFMFAYMFLAFMTLTTKSHEA